MPPKTPRTENYSVDEDIAIAKAYSAASQDAVVGTSQTSSQWDEKLFAAFRVQIPGTARSNPNPLRQRYNKLNANARGDL
ncbi:hypothetical protein BDR26DRAFT_1010926 [Obelidium mucronatum]|nr:hypothetical protein BDR26DRAFT_1010926 [Obelidium mucronatum]